MPTEYCPDAFARRRSENYAIWVGPPLRTNTWDASESARNLSESAKSLRDHTGAKPKRNGTPETPTARSARGPLLSRRNPAGAISSIYRERSAVNVLQKVKNRRALFAFAIAILIVELATALLIAPAFAADLPTGVGSLNDYMHQSGDGPATAPSSPAYSPPAYSPQYVPPRGYAPERSLAQEWNNTDPDTRRNLLIGAAVVGAVALGMWAYQQHEQYQARHARRRFYGRRPGFNE
jgi:hypothetical protein